ncbi:DUF6529 family protein [Cellulomonas sp. Root137]|uniref:DUF6529 family protein n=1 Tax=Cellulomonas sp. Root137 TaxID=1736459 RepID=UPI000701D85A|nr:DUF6529 family protein [Cellulomonas sp. Root137]KQY43984.1 hypothetical protein ASD18_16715 [Cellulomonas sp. Root137]KRD45185.1 hypothetical protein ASE38_14490 [Cellulomonas sp. Root930]
MSTATRAADLPPQWGLAALGAVGLAVAAALAGYAQVHPGDGAALTTLGFSGMLQMKSWLTTAAAALVVVQLLSALAMWGRLPGVTDAPGWVTGLHRWSGTVAFLLTLPVVFHCVWSLGFEDESTRVLVHSVAGCVFYGVFAAKMLALRLHRLPSAAVPVLGGLLAGVLVVLWFSSALWFFGQSGYVSY